MRQDPKNFVILVLGLALVCVLMIPVVKAGSEDGGGGDADRGLIAVTGTYGSGASALYLIDTRTRHLAVYRLENGRALELVAARNCSYDFLLETYNDQTQAGMLPAGLRRSWQELNRESATKSVPGGGDSNSRPTGTKPDSTLPPAPPAKDETNKD
jgi:hypothetical protein